MNSGWYKMHPNCPECRYLADWRADKRHLIKNPDYLYLPSTFNKGLKTKHLHLFDEEPCPDMTLEECEEGPIRRKNRKLPSLQ